MTKTKFEIYKDNKGSFKWRLISQNGNVIANSAEGFSEKRGALNVVKKLKDWANTENIIDIEKAKEEAKKLKEKESKGKANSKSKKVETKKVTVKKNKTVQPKPVEVKKVADNKKDKKAEEVVVKTII